MHLYLDGGRAPGGVASTIVDATGDRLRLVRAGAVTLAALRTVAPVASGDDDPLDHPDDAGDDAG